MHSIHWQLCFQTLFKQDPTNPLRIQIDLHTEQSVLSIERVMKSSYYDLLDKYFGEFCGDGDTVDVVDEKVMDLALT